MHLSHAILFSDNDIYLILYKTKIEDDKGAIRSRGMKDKRYNGHKKKAKGTNNDLQTETSEMFTDTKGVIRSWTLKKDKQYNR